jgi:hypothetical protein
MEDRVDHTREFFPFIVIGDNYDYDMDDDSSGNLLRGCMVLYPP